VSGVVRKKCCCGEVVCCHSCLCCVSDNAVLRVELTPTAGPFVSFGVPVTLQEATILLYGSAPCAYIEQSIEHGVYAAGHCGTSQGARQNAWDLGHTKFGYGVEDGWPAHVVLSQPVGALGNCCGASRTDVPYTMTRWQNHNPGDASTQFSVGRTEFRGSINFALIGNKCCNDVSTGFFGTCHDTEAIDCGGVCPEDLP
jgi:hypothetical protein